jgi:glutathione S-transferase
MPRTIDVGSSILASTLSGWRGSVSFRPARQQPEKLLELYEYEASPYCRLVREVLTELDLDAMIYPCPQQGRRFRPKVIEMGGKAQFPYLVDPNTETRMYESADIIEYLARTYDGRLLRPARGLRRGLGVGSGFLNACARGYRGFRGYKARPSHAPKQPLELFSFESSPYSRLVREVLCELELPYVLRSTGKARWSEMGPPVVRDRVWKAPMDTGRNRVWLAKNTGRVQLPYLVDPNTATAMYESAAIVAYLKKTYSAR